MISTTPMRILLVDDQPLFRGALASLLAEQPDMLVVGEAENGLDAVEQAHALLPDLVVMDVEMPVMGGVEATGLLRDQLPGIKVVMLTVSDADEHLLEAVRLGAHGYLLKDLHPAELYTMLRSVMRDGSPLSPAVAGRLMAEVRDGSTARRGTARVEAPPVSRRELEILRLVADGLSNREIGKKLCITEGTVKNHVHNALEKLHVENRVQAAAYITRQGLGHRPPA